MTVRARTADAILEAARPTLPVRREAFLQAVVDGRSSLRAIALYVDSMAEIADALSRSLGRLLAACPSRRLRVHILENLLEEEGVEIAGGSLRLAPGRDHGTLARRTAAALDPRPRAERPRPVAGESRWLDETVAAGRWPAAAAYLFAAWEGVSPDMCAALLEGLRTHHRVREEDLEYLVLHEELDREHSRVGGELLAAELRGDDEWRDAFAGARYGVRACRVWHARVGRAAARLGL